MAQDPQDVRTKLSFNGSIADISLSHLLELMMMLRSYKEGMVIVGGWTPYLLLRQFQREGVDFRHVGSVDIDIAINPTIIDKTQYAGLDQLLRARGYKPHPVVEYSYSKQVVDQDGIEREIIIDFLAPVEGGTSASHRNQRVQTDFLARKAKGADLAFDHRIALNHSGVLPNKAEAATTFYIADIVAIMAMKGYVLGQRLKEKDAYDIYSLAMYYKQGVESVAQELKPYKDQPLMQESIENIRTHFASPNAVGPIAVADFFQESGEQREQRAQQAYLQLQRLLSLLAG